jgi:hypothetical protein
MSYLQKFKDKLFRWVVGPGAPTPPPQQPGRRKKPETPRWEIAPWEKFKPNPQTRDPAEDFARRLEKLARKHF